MLFRLHVIGKITAAAFCVHKLCQPHTLGRNTHHAAGVVGPVINAIIILIFVFSIMAGKEFGQIRFINQITTVLLVHAKHDIFYFVFISILLI